MPMELTTENGSVLHAPSADQLRATLDTLSPDNAFAILARSEEQYVQIMGSRSGGYAAEYREGSEESHHQSVSTALTHEQVQALMAAYLAGGAWKGLLAWQPGMGRKTRRVRVTRAGAGGKLSWLFLVPFLLVGVGATAASATLAVKSYRFQQRAVSAPGKVVQLVGRDHDVKSAVVDYVDATGEPRRLQTSWSSDPPAFHVGERVQVLHDPRDPEHPRSARIDCFGDLWGTSAFLAIFGVVFGGVAVGALFAFRRR